MGRYITAEDMGTSVADMMYVKQTSKHVVGTDPKLGGAGDPSPWTAKGVFYAMQAASERVFGSGRSLRGKRVSVQGIGNVGMHLVEHLAHEGAIVTVCDTQQSAVDEAVKKFGVTASTIENIYEAPCDIFAPCAIGQTINKITLPRLKAKIIAGAANNQLSDPSIYSLIAEQGVLYCPDFAINSGGVICVCAEATGRGTDTTWIQSTVDAIYDTTGRVLDESKRRGKFTEAVAVELAKEIIQAAKSRKDS
jgi:leucine dehydrogenase